MHDSAPDGNDGAPRQAELPLAFPELSGDLPLLPARMVNEYEYCPRPWNGCRANGSTRRTGWKADTSRKVDAIEVCRRWRLCKHLLRARRGDFLLAFEVSRTGRIRR